jgi:hypothetical protein
LTGSARTIAAIFRIELPKRGSHAWYATSGAPSFGSPDRGLFLAALRQP